LPGTDEDLIHFKKIVDNFNFPEEHTVVIELLDPDCDQVDAKMKEVLKSVTENVEQNLRTFFTFFYAGHGAMQDNLQWLVLNGVEKMVKNKKTRKEEMQWVYLYPIERKLHENFKPFGTRMFSFVVFDCCRSNLIETNALTLSELDEILLQNEEMKFEEVKELARGDGDDSVGMNILQVCAAKVNSTVMDYNALVAMMLSELRLNQINK